MVVPTSRDRQQSANAPILHIYVSFSGDAGGKPIA